MNAQMNSNTRSSQRLGEYKADEPSRSLAAYAKKFKIGHRHWMRICTIDQGKKVDSTTEIFGEFYGPALTAKEYVILSHCWGVAEMGEKEVSFKEMSKLLSTLAEKQERWARVGGSTLLQIKKVRNYRNSTQYKWYAKAKLCYGYLHDTVGDSWKDRGESKAIPKWFSRGWTLQELIAPKVFHFFDQNWEWIGNKAARRRRQQYHTNPRGSVERRIAEGVEQSKTVATVPNVAQIISWLLIACTCRCCMGKGRTHFVVCSLNNSYVQRSSIFTWGLTREYGWSSSILADDPSCFRDCGMVVSLTPEQISKDLIEKGMPDGEVSKSAQKRLRTFTVTNDGIQIWLPTATFGPYSQVTLACWDQDEDDLMTIHLLFRGSTCFRIFGIPKYPGKMEFKQYLLPYKETECPTFTFALQTPTLSHDGFALDRARSAGAEVIKDGSVTLSGDIDFAAIAYLRGKDDTLFLVLLSYCAGRHSAFVILAPEDFKWDLAFLRSRAFERLFNSNHKPSSDECPTAHRRAAQLQSMLPNVMVVCPREERSTYELVEASRIPGLMWNSLRGKLPQTRELSEKYASIPFSLIESELKLGDYGHVPQDGEKFKPEGNIIDFATGIAPDPIESDIDGIHRPELGSAESMVSLSLKVAGRWTSRRLHLYDGTGWSLPANQQVVSLLKVLSSRLAGRVLVTAVIRCSDRHDLRPKVYSTSTPRGTLDLNAWQTLDTPTPLCSVIMPLSWRQVDLDGELMTLLLQIIDNFSVLAGWVEQLEDPKHLTQPVTVEAAAEFFAGLFGGTHFRNFIGDIVFFNDLPRIMEMKNKSHTGLDTGLDKGRHPSQDISGGREAIVVAQAQRIDALVVFLTGIDDGTFDLELSPEFVVHVGSKRAGWTNLWRNGSGWRSAPFATKIVELIAAEYRQRERQDIKFDRHEFLSTVEQIKKWRKMLIATNDEHERRTLVEDTVGKVTLLTTAIAGWLAEVGND
ncbi:hypothetical protein EDC04DRAFT_2896808 [Pisolithus marmoratus]|nr:hypothetical protein EDC04DRAFT_2896808 [Pisolithus marmoratus]